MASMRLDPTQSADKLVQEERARRPRWRDTSQRTPSWFDGEELGLLEPAERDRLYQELRSRHQAVQWLPLVIASANLANAFHSLRSQRTQLLYLAMATGFVLVAIGAAIYRRQSIVSMARRHVRESADWPLRLERHTVRSPD